MNFELNNEQRLYFGLDPILPHWDKVIFQGNKYNPETILYFDGDIIKRHIKSTEHCYAEVQFNEKTRNREFLLPKTLKGKEKKLNASTFEKVSPIGVYCRLEKGGRVLIGNNTSITCFYDSHRENYDTKEALSFPEIVENYISLCPPGYLDELQKFRFADRKHVKYKAGDFFTFKINNSEYGFGRVLLDIHELKKSGYLNEPHEWLHLLFRPVLVKTYAFIAGNKAADLEVLEKMPALPSDYMTDDKLYCGEFEIIGNRPLRDSDFDFPMLYSRSIVHRNDNLVFQWGFINIELPETNFSKYLSEEPAVLIHGMKFRSGTDRFRYSGTSIYPGYSSGFLIRKTIENNGLFVFVEPQNFKMENDLRNPANSTARADIMNYFGLDPLKSYDENCTLTGTIRLKDLAGKVF
ncbi:MAG: immunity 26/phosphotriesterase HocA family protein [Bacteroidota bacterium]